MRNLGGHSISGSGKICDGVGGFCKSQEHWLCVGTVGIRRFGVTSGSLDTGGVAGTTEILESEVGVGGPSEIVGDSEVMEIYVGGWWKMWICLRVNINQ